MRNEKGTYVLILTLDKEAAIAVGKLGMFSFPAGYYLYIGSALGGLFARVRRHIQGGKKIHWHIDYLRQKAKVVEIWYMVSEGSLECSWSQAAANLPEAQSLPVGFGSSECSCRSHLLYFNSKPSFETFRHLLGVRGNYLVKNVLP